MKRAPLRVAAVGDLHYTRHSKGKAQPLFDEVSQAADVLLLAGDLTDYGQVEEAKFLADDIRSHLKIPVFAVFGNHDQESGQTAEMEEILYQAGVTMLDGECAEVGDVGIAGVCGFGGGFGPRMLNAWGEPIIKAFVQEAVDHSLRLEKALSRLTTEKKIVLLHYAPIRDTVVGEDPEIFAFCGSSRLEGVCNRFEVHSIFHGHAHHGTRHGRTSADIPVQNVSLPLLQATEKVSFAILEV